MGRTKKTESHQKSPNKSRPSTSAGKAGSNPVVSERPKRQVMPKSLELTSTLSWKEEKALQKALYASLHETTSSPVQTLPPVKPHRLRKGVKMKCGRKKGLKLLMPDRSNKTIPNTAFATSSSNSTSGQLTPVSVSNGSVECGQHSGQHTSQHSSHHLDKRQVYKPTVRAQRKFAQGSLPNSPCVTPVKQQPRVPSPVKYMMRQPPKTEDFIHFLCLRGTEFLPKKLEFFNYCDPDLYSAMNTPVKSGKSSRPATPQPQNGGGGGGNGRPGRPRGRPPNSRAVSPGREDSTDADELGVKPLVNKAYASCYAAAAVVGGPSTSVVLDNDSTTSATCMSNTYPPSSFTALEAAEAASQKQAMEGVIASRAKAALSQPMRLRSSRPPIIMCQAPPPLLASHRMSFSSSPKAPPPADSQQQQPLTSPSKTNNKHPLKLNKPHLKPGRPRKLPLHGNTKSDKPPYPSFSSPKTPSSSTHHLPKSPRTIKKERGKKLVRLARKTIARRQYMETGGSGGEERRVTRRLREKLETEQFQEDRLEALYSRKGEGLRPPQLIRAQSTDSLRYSSSTSQTESGEDRRPGKRQYRFNDEELPSLSLPKRSRRSLQLEDAKVTLTARHSPREIRSHDRSLARQEVEVENKSRVLRSSMSPSKMSASMTGENLLQSIVGGTKERSGRSPCRASVAWDSSDMSRSKGKASRASLEPPRLREPFPLPQGKAKVVLAPTYQPSPEKFSDPIDYIECIRPDAEPYGLCCIVPPEVWKPECCVSQELRFITEIQHLHKMKERWGSNVQEMECIRKHMTSQGQRLEAPPIVGGIELDLPALSRAIAQCGGIQFVADDKRKWMKVADILRIPRWAQDRSFKLYDVYCKHLLSYDTLTGQERERIAQQVFGDKNRGRLNLDCVLKGKSRSLAEFFNSARSALVRWFDGPPSSSQVEAEYWRILNERSEHVSVNSAHVDTKHCGGGFPTKKDSPYSRHGWNFNILQHNNASVLKHLGLVSGVTIPELHMGMLFSTNCWCSDPHGLPYVSYLHTGGDIIWYCVPKSEEQKFKEVLLKLAPDLIDADSPIWLPVDSIMLSPEDLVAAGVSVSRITQKQGEFMVIFPQSFTATICAGYNISESIRFATSEWIPTGYNMSLALHESCEPELFSMDRLLVRLARSEKTDTETLHRILPTIENMINMEIALRQKLEGAGLKSSERLRSDRSPDLGRKKRTSLGFGVEEESRCEVSKKICYLSMVLNESEGTVFSLEHSYPLIHRKKQIKHYKLLYRFSEGELLEILHSVKQRVVGASPTRGKAGKSSKKQH